MLKTIKDICFVVSEMYDFLGYGITGFEDQVQTVWWLPLLLVAAYILAVIFCPKYGVIYPIKGKKNIRVICYNFAIFIWHFQFLM